MSSVDRPCALCGDMMENPHPARKFCGELCKEAARYGLTSPLTCGGCGKRMRVNMKSGKASLPQGQARCLDCRRASHGVTRYKKHGCRCEVCVTAIREAARRHREKVHAEHGMSNVSLWRMRYHEKHGHLPPGQVDRRSDWLPRAVRVSIYERDNWTCGICGDAIPRDVHSNDNQAASLDHIIPRSHGGSDDPSNLRASHRYCNTVRSNRVDAA